MRPQLVIGAVVFAFGAFGALGLGVSAQQIAPQQPTLTFRATADLIVQTVTVKDKTGQPVLGLTAKDFVVTEDGQPQDIAFVEYEALNAGPATAPALTTGSAPPPISAPTSAVASTTPDVVSVPGAAAYRGRRLLVLYLDLSKMPFFDQLRTFDGAYRYITTEMTPADLVAIMVYDGAGVRLKQNFTDDRAALRTTIQALADAAEAAQNGLATNFDPSGAFGEDDATFNVFATDRQLAALQTAVTDLGPLPEVKTLVYLGGLSLQGIDNQAQLRATVNAAVRANVTLNPIDARGLVASAPLGDATQASPGGVGMFSGILAQNAIAAGQGAQNTLYALAKDTGGKAMFDNNDLTLGIVQAARAVTGYYMIGYYTKHLVKDGKYRHVTIALADGRVATLSFRPGYYGDKEFSKFTKADKERQLEDALRLEDPVTDIPMAMEVNYFQLNRAEYYIPVSVRMPASELTRPKPGGTAQAEIDMIGEVKDTYGVTIQNMRDTLVFTLDAAKAADVAKRPIQYETGFTLLPGAYVIKVLARDATTGHIGTFEKAFTVPNLEHATAALPISSVVLSNQRVVATDALYTVKQKISTDAVNPLIDQGQKLIPSVTRTFSTALPLLVFLQAYEHDAAAMRPLVAFVTFYLDGVKAFETEPLAIAEGWNPKSKAVPIRFSVPLESLKPGSYDCQVTVLDPSGSRAAFWRTPIALIR